LAERGHFLEGLYNPWTESLRTRLSTLRRSAMLRVIETNLERGLLDRVEELCQELLTEDEFDEEALRGLMISAARRRQSSKVVTLFEDFAQKLQAEFQSDPSPALQSLFEALTAAVDGNVEHLAVSVQKTSI
jgi:DNA-binding SARP family transcriptional activator